MSESVGTSTQHCMEFGKPGQRFLGTGIISRSWARTTDEEDSQSNITRVCLTVSQEIGVHTPILVSGVVFVVLLTKSFKTALDLQIIAFIPRVKCA